MAEKDSKTLYDYKEEIHRCSKCGICQSSCPLYQLTGNECTVSRGQFIMLDGVVNNKLDLTKNINKYLDLCLKCNKCSHSCPSGIEVIDILLAAKHEYFKNSLQGKIYGFLESKMFFNSILNTFKFFTKAFRKKSKPCTKKAVYFGGCISAIKPDTHNFIITLLNKMDIEVVEADFGCCGMPFLTTGNLERFKEQIKDNLEALPEDFDYFITDCASCEWAWSQYSKYVDDERLANIPFKNIYELIAESDIKFETKKKQRVTYHQPCHETHNDEILKIIQKIEGLEYCELKGKDECCGFASFENPTTLKTTFPVFKKKAENIKKTHAKTVLTTCVGCLVSLNLITKGKANRLISFLRKNCFIK